MGDIYELNSFNAGAGYIRPPTGSLNLADPPPKVDKIISGLGKIATRAENFIHSNIRPEHFVERLKVLLPQKPIYKASTDFQKKPRNL